MNIEVIGVPVDLGADRRGVDMGPSAIRYAGLKNAITELGLHYVDLGNIDVPSPKNLGEYQDPSMKYLDEVTTVNERLASRVIDSHKRGSKPLVLGGDHSIAVGTIIGTQTVFNNIGVIWMDAHGDFNNNRTTISGNLHGMPLAACAGYGPAEMTDFKGDDVPFIDPEKIVLIGVRDLDDKEKQLIRTSGVHVFTMADIDVHGMRHVMSRALRIVNEGTNGFHLSFDMDVLTPTEAPGVGTPVPGGLTYREAHLAAEMIAEHDSLRSFEFVEVNPILDQMNQTAKVAVTLIASVLGKRII
jgi:arginase